MSSDTLLNVFLAIAVDNLANAHILTADEEAEQKERENKKSFNKEKYQPKHESEKKNGWIIAKRVLPNIFAVNHMKKNNNKHQDEEAVEDNASIPIAGYAC